MTQGIKEGADAPPPAANPTPEPSSPPQGDAPSTASAEDSTVISAACNQAAKINQTDESGHVITYIYARTKKYIIYESDGQLRFVLPDNFETARGLRANIACLGGLRSSIESMRSEPCLGKPEARRAGLEMAWAMGLAFDAAAEAAADQPKEILTRVDDRLRSLVKSHFRKTYAFANLKAFSAIASSLALLAISLSEQTSPIFTAIRHYAAFGMFGALGAFLSVIIGIKSIDIDINLGPWEHIFAGATRIMIGVIGAWIVALTLDAHFIAPMFGTDNAALPAGQAAMGFSPREALYFIFAFIGGFSQTLVPSLLQRGEDAVGDTAKRPAPATAPIVKGMKP